MTMEPSDAAGLDRRTFLIGGVSGLLLAAMGSVLPSGCSRYPKPARPLQFLNAREYAILNIVAARLLGVGDQVGGNAMQIDVAANVDTVVARWRPDSQAQLRTVLRVFEHGTYLFDLQRHRFTRLSAEQQDQYLAGWMTSTLGARRVVFRVLKALAAAGFYHDPRTWRRLGYPGPWLGRVYAESLVELPAAVPLGRLVGRTP